MNNYICCLILQKYQILLFISTATTTECDLCNKNGQCVISSDAQVSCDCRAWFAGRNCQINLKLLLIVGCVSVILMVVIACGVSCFCCRERGKNDIPCKYFKKVFITILFCNKSRYRCIYLYWHVCMKTDIINISMRIHKK